MEWYWIVGPPIVGVVLGMIAGYLMGYTARSRTWR